MPESFQARVQHVTAGDAMTRELVTVTPEMSAYDVAETMRRHRIHRVLVCSGGTLCGVITTFDLLRAIPVGRAASGPTRSTGYRR